MPVLYHLLTFHMWPEAIGLNYRLASLLASKWEHPYSCTLCWLRCSLAFSLLHSAIQSIRGARSPCRHAIKTSTVVDLVNVESNISLDVQLMNTNPSLSFFIFLPVHHESLVLYLFLQLCFHHMLLLVYIPITFWLDIITPQVERRKKEEMNVEKSHKSACVCPMF